LGVAHFDEGSAETCGVMGVVEEPGQFGFGRRCHDIAEDVADGVDGPVVLGWNCGDGTRVRVTEEKMAADATACAAFGEIGGVAVDPEDHFAGVIADHGIGMACGVVE
jgi:hypothetical protein